MEQLKMFLTGCMAVCIITFVVNAILKKQPNKADKLIDYILFFVLAILIGYAFTNTDWSPVEEKLSKDLKEYRETQRNMWKLN